ncbi:IS481 family transposase, partial [Mycoplana sp. MJR14]|uniref:IS481 family transposase n=1 Tax=Mycoplana sp. MJR14 TaxID=3032583 RepID=UPI0023DBD4BB
MNIHKNARLTPLRREEMALAVIAGLPVSQAARVYGVSAKIVARWVERFRAGGRDAMLDRTSRPHSIPRQTGQALAERIIALRRQRLTGKHIAIQTGVSPATVSRVLKRAGLSRLKDIEPAVPVVRYDYAQPGGLIHLDIKRLGRFERVGHRITGNRTGQSNSRGVGWEYVHVCIDDASRIAFTDIFPDEKAASATTFLKRAIAYYQTLGITVTRVMTDNGSCYKAHAFRDLCKELGLKHIRTKPYTPKTNGKAERFIQTALREWA